MKHRKKLSRKGSRRLFSKTAQKVKIQNLRASPMRGGYRI